jgi:hypothetical protein
VGGLLGHLNCGKIQTFKHCVNDTLEMENRIYWQEKSSLGYVLDTKVTHPYAALSISPLQEKIIEYGLFIQKVQTLSLCIAVQC